MVFFISRLQADHLARWQPAQCWRRAAEFHRASVRVRFALAPSLCARELELCVGRTRMFTRVDESRSSRRFPPRAGRLALASFSPTLQYLSVIETEPRPELGDESVTVVDFHAKSVSMLPAWVPLGVLPALLLFWVPFPDGQCAQARLSLSLSLSLCARQKAHHGLRAHAANLSLLTALCEHLTNSSSPLAESFAGIGEKAIRALARDPEMMVIAHVLAQARPRSSRQGRRLADCSMSSTASHRRACSSPRS